MDYPVSHRRRACLGLAMGLVADRAFPRGLASMGRASPDTDGHVRYRVVHHFSGPDGANPQAGLILAGDGEAYGTANAGGEHGKGVIYHLTRDHRVKVLHSFAGGANDGASPSTYSLVDADGALYGSTFDGGENEFGVAFRLDSASGFTMLHRFGIQDCTSGELMHASDGNFYGAGGWGGRYFNGTVFRMDKAGNTTVLWDFGEELDDPQDPCSGLIEATDGRLYGTTYDGGTDGNGGTVYTLLKDGTDRRVLHSFVNGDEKGRHCLDTVMQAADGNLYGVSLDGGPYYWGGAVFRLGLDGAFEVVHTFGGDGDGYYPHSPLLEIRPGVFVGTTHFGGKAGGGVVYQVHADGRYRVLHHFGGDVHGTPDGRAPMDALQMIAPGHVLGICPEGGAFDLGTLWVLHVDAA